MADTHDEAREAILQLIRDTASELNNSQSHTSASRTAGALALAEALAWATSPAQSHGGGAKTV